MRRVRVEVTAEDIAAGEKNRCEACPIALALKRATGACRAYIDHEEIRVWNLADDSASHGTTPAEADAFIRAFDLDDGVPRPFAFEVELR